MREAEDAQPFRLLLGYGRYERMTPGEGYIDVGDGDGKLPSLADTIAAVRRELTLAQAAGLRSQRLRCLGTACDRRLVEAAWVLGKQ